MGLGINLSFRKNSLTWAFIKQMIIIAGLALLLFWIFNKYIFPTYYYWRLEAPVKRVEAAIRKKKDEQKNDEVISLKIKGYSSFTIEELNNNVDLQFTKQKHPLSKFWISTDIIEKVGSGQTVQRLYHQGSQKSDFYSRYFSIGDTLYIVGTNIPSFKEVTSTLLPLVLLTFFLILLLLITSLIYNVQKGIIKPIKRLENVTRRISNLDFSKSKLQAKNELSILTESINEMSHSLQMYERNLLDRNEQLKNFSSNLSHELKTPLSIIQLLIDSEKMGIRNDKFLEELNIQLIRINELIKSILDFSQQEKEDIIIEKISLSQLLKEEIEKISFIDPGFTTVMSLGEVNIQTSRWHLQIIINNLFTNALKYSCDKNLSIDVEVQEDYYIILFKNRSQEFSKSEMKRLKEPFEVGEKSRNHVLSGTGLGFSIIGQALESIQGHYSIEQNNGVFIVEIVLPQSPSA